MRKWSRMSITYFVLFFVFIGCSKGSESIDSVSVCKMEDFSTVQENSLMMFTDSKVISEFAKAINNANREPGIANMANPEYKVEIGEDAYFLWISEQYGTIMYLNDTNTIYTLTKSSAKSIYELLNY